MGMGGILVASKVRIAWNPTSSSKELRPAIARNLALRDSRENRTAGFFQSTYVSTPVQMCFNQHLLGRMEHTMGRRWAVKSRVKRAVAEWLNPAFIKGFEITQINPFGQSLVITPGIVKNIRIQPKSFQFQFCLLEKGRLRTKSLHLLKPLIMK